MAFEKIIFLKVKIKSLAAESKIIRFQERKAKGGTALRTWLHAHRVAPVRYEARHALLAYGFLRGKKLSQIEQKSKLPFSKKRVKQLVTKYGSEYLGFTPELTAAQDEVLTKWMDGN